MRISKSKIIYDMCRPTNKQLRRSWLVMRALYEPNTLSKAQLLLAKEYSSKRSRAMQILNGNRLGFSLNENGTITKQ